MSLALDERDRSRAAMDRILSGKPENSNGALTIVALVQEADVPRNALTQRHLDLKKEFYDHLRDRGAVNDTEARLRAKITRLKKTIDNKNKEPEQLRADVPALVRTVNQLTLENHLIGRRERVSTAGPLPFQTDRAEMHHSIDQPPLDGCQVRAEQAIRRPEHVRSGLVRRDAMKIVQSASLGPQKNDPEMTPVGQPIRRSRR